MAWTDKLKTVKRNPVTFAITYSTLLHTLHWVTETWKFKNAHKLIHLA